MLAKHFEDNVEGNRMTRLMAILIMTTGVVAYPAVANENTTDLHVFYNKYPNVPVGEFSFKSHPKVQSAVRRAINTSYIQELVLDEGVTASPIDGIGGYLQSWACEPHNCGDHNWIVAVAADGSKAAVCYYNSDLSNGARWFVDGKKVHDGFMLSCRSGRMPSRVTMALEAI